MVCSCTSKLVIQNVQVEEGDNDNQDRSYQWKRLFLMYCHHEFFNASPQHPQISHKQHIKEETKREIVGYMLPPTREAHILVKCIIALDESILRML